MTLFTKLETIEKWYNQESLKSLEPLIDNLNIFIDKNKEIVFNCELEDLSK